MTRFALPYAPDTAPVLWLPGHGFTPAWQPADYIGARLDCPMWLPAPDADMAFAGKVPPALAGFDPYAHVADLLTILPATEILGRENAPVTAKVVSFQSPTPALPWHPATPTQPWWLVPGPDHPCRCITAPPENPMPPIAPVPVSADAALLLATGLAAILIIRRFA